MTLSESDYHNWTRMHESKADRLEAFNEAKFGMFIHWGPYAIPGGIWKGQKMEEEGVGARVAEWVMRRRSIPREEYAEMAGTFNPVKFDADEWAQIASDAGMNYMVITSKHHDGFAMYDSSVSDYSIAKATPFKRDVVDELHAACADKDVQFGLYYSHALDWFDGGDLNISNAEHPSGLPAKAWNNWDPSPRTFEDYLTNKSLPQVEELAERYPDLALFWFDFPGYLTEETSFDFYRRIYQYAPHILVSSRLSADHLDRNLGDYESAGDNSIPDPHAIGNPFWETCGTMNNSWGYNSYDHDWKYPLEVLSWLVDVVSRGGNYLLNVGPDSHGVIPAESVTILRKVGQWMKVNGEAIYGTRAWTTFREGETVLNREGTLARMKEGFSATFTPQDIWFTKKGETVYAIGLAFSKDEITIRSMKGANIRSVRLLGSDQEVTWRSTPEGLCVTLPGAVSEIGYALAIDPL